MNKKFQSIEIVDDIYIVKNLISKQYINALEQYLTTSPTYRYNPKTSYVGFEMPENLNDQKIYDVGQLCKVIFNHGDYRDTEALNFLYPIFYTIQDILPELNITSMLRAKVNGLVKGGEETRGKTSLPHYDNETGYAAVFYLNDSDGCTRIYNSYYSETETQFNFDVDSFDIKPEKNKIVIFPANKWHASSCPVDNAIRWVLNFNFL